MRQKLNDDNVRELYQLLIGKSHEEAENFERYQNAWEAVAEVLHVDKIENNGHGRIIWRLPQ